MSVFISTCGTPRKYLTSAEALAALDAGARFRFDGDKYYIDGSPDLIQPHVVDRIILTRRAEWDGATVKGLKKHGEA